MGRLLTPQALFRGAIEKVSLESVLHTKDADHLKAKLRYIVEADLSPRNVFIDPEHWVRRPQVRWLASLAN